jgi:hypothetical protein
LPYEILFVCLFVYSRLSNYSAIWWLSSLLVTELQTFVNCFAITSLLAKGDDP